MDTLQEALFKAMLNDMWFTASDGDIESPTGYFGYVVNSAGDWGEVEDAFADTIKAYGGSELSPDKFGEWVDTNFYGVYAARINSDGIITIRRVGDYVRTPGVAVMGIEFTPVVKEAMQWFDSAVSAYTEWADQTGEDI